MRKWICVAAILLLLSACGGKMVPPPPEDTDAPATQEPEDLPETTEESENPEIEQEAALQALLKSMTLDEKVGQLFFVQVPGDNAVEDVMTYHLGGYILFGRDTGDKTASALMQTIDSYQKAAGRIPLLIGVDEEGGTVVRVSSNPHLRSKKFSSPRTMLKMGGEAFEAVEKETEEKSLLLKRLGFHVNLNPVADVSKNSGDFIYDRTYGDSAAEAAEYASRVVKIQSAYGLGSVLKHFPGYGNNQDTHTGIAVDNRPLETFLEEDFLPFREAIATGEEYPPRPAVLVSHNIVNCMDPDLPASLSPEVHRILREDLGFEGVVMTDDLSMDAVAEYAGDGAAAVMALQAGNDMVITADYRAQIPRAIEAVKDGKLNVETVEAACLRVLHWKLELGLLKADEDGKIGG